MQGKGRELRELRAAEETEVAMGEPVWHTGWKAASLGTGPRRPPGTKALTVHIPGPESWMEQGAHLRGKTRCPGSLLCLQWEPDGAGGPTDTRGPETTAGQPGGRSAAEDALPQPGELSEDGQQGEKKAGSLTISSEEGEVRGVLVTPYPSIGGGLQMKEGSPKHPLATPLTEQRPRKHPRPP